MEDFKNSESKTAYEKNLWILENFNH